MYAQFFKQSRPRYQNPTYQSNSVFLSMLAPQSKYDIIRSSISNNHQQKNNLISNNSSGMATGLASESYSTMFEKNQSMEMIPRYVSMSESTMLAGGGDPYRHRRSKSHLSSYGSNTIQSLPKPTDKQVFQHQQNPVNIINLAPKQYKQSIKMFPKFRNELKQDQPNRIRQAFISGKPEIAITKSRQFIANQVGYDPNQRGISYERIKNYGSKSVGRLNPEYGK